MFQDQSNLKSKIDARRLHKIATKTIKSADYVYSFGGHIDEILKDLYVEGNRILLQMNGIASDWISPKELSLKQCRRFIFIGRDERRKGIIELNEAVKNLVKANADFSVDFIGPISKELEQFEQVTYHGVIKDKNKLIELLDNSDCLLCPSYSEGMPTVIAEAMARGCAIIATDVGAVSRQFAENGVLLESSDPKKISDAMLYLMNKSPEEFLELRKKSIKKASDEFTWERIVQTKIEQFKKILNSEPI